MLTKNKTILNTLIFSLILIYSVLPIFSYELSIFVLSLMSIIICFSISNKDMLDDISTDLSTASMLIFGSQLFTMSMFIFFGDILNDRSLYELKEMYTHMVLYFITFLISFLGFSIIKNNNKRIGKFE